MLYKEFNNIINKYTKNYSKKDTDKIKNLLYNYVLNNPCKDGSKQSKKFKDYGLCNKHDYSKVLKSIRELVNVENYMFIKTGHIEQELIEKFDNCIKNSSKMIIFKNNGIGQLDSLFYRIRNAFAHGNFIINKKMYIMWNEQKEKIYSICILSYEDLIAILDSVLKFVK